jgi:predicted phosphate transport protein (TIGR00153 family)
MNIDYFLKFFIPKDESFFPLFEENSKILIKASELLKLLMATTTFEEREQIIKEIKAAELAGDEMIHKIFDQINHSFITPFDREDIQGLASSMDDVLDYINGVGQRVLLYKPKSFIKEFTEMADLINKAAIEIDIAVHSLRNAGRNRIRIIENCIKINTIENKADELYHLGISGLFEHEENTNELIKKKGILETLEKVADKAEDVSDVIKTILIKMT